MNETCAMISADGRPPLPGGTGCGI